MEYSSTGHETKTNKTPDTGETIVLTSRCQVCGKLIVTKWGNFSVEHICGLNLAKKPQSTLRQSFEDLDLKRHIPTR